MRGARRPYQARQARAYMTAASSLVNSMNSTRFSPPRFKKKHPPRYGSGMVFALLARQGDAYRLRASPALLFRRAATSQPIQPVEQVAHRSGHPETVSPCRWNSACREGCRDGIRRGNAARPYFGNDRGERGRARICFRRAYPAGSFPSLRRRHCFDSHCNTTMRQSNQQLTGTPAKSAFVGTEAQSTEYDNFVRIKKGASALILSKRCKSATYGTPVVRACGGLLGSAIQTNTRRASKLVRFKMQGMAIPVSDRAIVRSPASGAASAPENFLD